MKLPKDFTNMMKNLLKEEYTDFIKSYDEERTYGLRINTLKIDREEFLKINPFHLENIPWVKEGFYYTKEDLPGKHPYHEAGLYYIQEPSAMAVVEHLDVQKGDKVLDLCAAPGGKSTQIAAKLQNTGFLLSNELYEKRAQILSENIERMGISNVLVTNETPEKLASRFYGYFDKVLIDAPCSGEGMFRKDPTVINEWSIENISYASQRQLSILNSGKDMLKYGGKLVYSTCTFSYEENEKVLEKFLAENRDFSLENSLRLWPHKIKGEGHFIAVLKKNSESKLSKINKIKDKINKSDIKDFFQFQDKYLNTNFSHHLLLFGNNLYYFEESLDLHGIKVVRPGLHLGTLKKNRFEPSHALALYLKKNEVKNTISLNSKSNEILLYLKGQSFKFNSENGWNLILVDEYSIGWGKVTDNLVKNHYPKGLRWT